MIFLVLILPLLVAGLVRVAVDQKRFLADPIDFGFTWYGSPLIGKSKTWGGFIILSCVAGAVGLTLQVAAKDWFYDIPLPLFYGILMGVGYSLGEIINSFVKRRLGVGEGSTFKNPVNAAMQYIIDQMDSFVALFLLGLVLQIPFWVNGSIFFIAVILHILVDAVNNVWGSKKYADKYALNSFYQILTFWALHPLRYLVKGNIQFYNHQKPFILTSNHLGWNDAFMFIMATDWQEFKKFAPFKILIREEHFRYWYGPYLHLIGGIESRWMDLFEGKPLERLERGISEGFSIIIFYEGKITKSKRAAETLRPGLYKLKSNHPSAPLVVLKLTKTPGNYTINQKTIIDGSFPMDKKDFNTLINNTVYN